MGLFRRPPRSRFPADTLQWLDVYGRHELDRVGSGIEPAALSEGLLLLWAEARRDPDGFLADLNALVADDRGGFATIGAAEVVWPVFDSETPMHPLALALIDAGIAVKQGRNLPDLMFPPRERIRIDELRGTHRERT
jgi:hypothetical protein